MTIGWQSFCNMWNLVHWLLVSCDAPVLITHTAWGNAALCVVHFVASQVWSQSHAVGSDGDAPPGMTLLGWSLEHLNWLNSSLMCPQRTQWNHVGLSFLEDFESISVRYLFPHSAVVELCILQDGYLYLWWLLHHPPLCQPESWWWIWRLPGRNRVASLHASPITFLKQLHSPFMEIASQLLSGMGV